MDDAAGVAFYSGVTFLDSCNAIMRRCYDIEREPVIIQGGAKERRQDKQYYAIECVYEVDGG